MGMPDPLARMPRVMVFWGYAMTENLSLGDMARRAEWETCLANM